MSNFTLAPCAIPIAAVLATVSVLTALAGVTGLALREVGLVVVRGVREFRLLVRAWADYLHEKHERELRARAAQKTIGFRG